MERKLAVFIDDGVTGIAAALIAHDHIVGLRQQVDHAALTLVAPVDTNDCTMCHILSSYALIVEIFGTTSSSTSSRMRTVSSEVNMVTPFSTAHRRICTPSS